MSRPGLITTLDQAVEEPTPQGQDRGAAPTLWETRTASLCGSGSCHLHPWFLWGSLGGNIVSRETLTEPSILRPKRMGPALYHPHDAAQAGGESNSYMSPGAGGALSSRMLHLALL